MKAKKLLALFLALIMALSCMSVAVMAEEPTAYAKDIKVKVPEITVGTTVANLKASMTFEDASMGNDINIHDVVLLTESIISIDKVETSGEYYLIVVFKIKNTTVYDAFQQKVTGSNISYAKAVTLSGGNVLGEFANTVGDQYSSMDDFKTTGEGKNIYCLSYQSLVLYDATLDLDETSANKDTYPSSITVDQLYDAKVTGDKTDVTKVQVFWTLENISVQVNNDKIWDTEKLEWVVDTTSSKNTATAEAVNATFTFVNLSSVGLYAKVGFAVNTGFTAVTPVFTENSDTANDGKVFLDTKAASENANNKETISVKVTPTATDFKSLPKDEDGSFYGKYTITLEALKTYSISCDNQNLTASVTSIGEREILNVTYTAKDGYIFDPTGLGLVVDGATIVENWVQFSDSCKRITFTLVKPTKNVTVTLTPVEAVEVTFANSVTGDLRITGNYIRQDTATNTIKLWVPKGATVANTNDQTATCTLTFTNNSTNYSAVICTVQNGTKLLKVDGYTNNMTINEAVTFTISEIAAG